jgi:hypothetical protein
MKTCGLRCCASLHHCINRCKASGGERFYLPARDMQQIRDVVEAPSNGHHMAVL